MLKGQTGFLFIPFYQYKDMDNFKILPINEQYNSEMLSILKASPINANGLSLYFDKSPDIFKIPGMKYSLTKHAGFFIDEKLKGFGSLGYYDALIKGRKENVFTFYNFYLLPEARGKKIPEFAAKEFFGHVRTQTANYGLSITMKGNRPAESYIDGRRDGWMPSTRVIDDLIVKTILFSKPKKNNTAYKVRNASTEDIPAIVKLLKEEHQQRDFGLIFQEDSFIPSLQKRKLQIENYFVATDNRGSIKGVCLAWDCSSFRRTTVVKFSPSFYSSLLAYKIAEKIFPLAPFPEMGKNFNELTITDYAAAGRNPVIMHALLSEIYYRNNNRKYHFMNWASCGSDSLLNAAKGFWYKNIVSHIIFTSMEPHFFNAKKQLPYIDIAFI